MDKLIALLTVDVVCFHQKIVDYQNVHSLEKYELNQISERWTERQTEKEVCVRMYISNFRESRNKQTNKRGCV